MDRQFFKPNRRRFLAAASACAACVAGHGSIASGCAGTTSLPDERKETGPRILRLELLTSAPLARMKEFYQQSLGLRVLDEQPQRLSIAAGATQITFATTRPDEAKPFYHFAFNIPENKLEAARTWQKERTPLLPVPAGLRDPQHPDDVVHFRHWNAHSVFFLDPGGNVLEHIARHDLQNAAQGSFDSKDILYASEIGLIVDAVSATASTLKGVVGLDQYKGGDEHFTALGDERGLLLVMKRGRSLSLASPEKKVAGVFRTISCLRGNGQTKYVDPQFPYEVSVE